MVNFEGVKSEKSLRTQIKRNLNKEIHDATIRFCVLYV